MTSSDPCGETPRLQLMGQGSSQFVVCPASPSALGPVLTWLIPPTPTRWSHMPTSSFDGLLPFQNSSRVSPVSARYLLSVILREPPHFLNRLVCISQLPSLPHSDNFLVFLSGECPSCLKRPGQNSPSRIPSFLPAFLFQSSPCGRAGLLSASLGPLLHCPCGPLASLLSPPSAPYTTANAMFLERKSQVSVSHHFHAFPFSTFHFLPSTRTLISPRAPSFLLARSILDPSDLC